LKQSALAGAEDQITNLQEKLKWDA
jgi:hypothetical protein